MSKEFCHQIVLTALLLELRTNGMYNQLPDELRDILDDIGHIEISENETVLFSTKGLQV